MYINSALLSSSCLASPDYSTRYCWISLGTPCSVWCIARRNVQRVAQAEAKDRLGVIFAVFSAEVIETCLAHNVLFALENPQTSRLWHFPRMAQALSDSRVNQVMFHACMFGAQSKKPTTVAGTLPGLCELHRKCDKSDNHQHERLSGRTTCTFHGKTGSVSRTAISGAYTNRFCAEISRLIEQAASMRRIPHLVEAVCVCVGDVRDMQVPFTVNHPRNLVTTLTHCSQKIVRTALMIRKTTKIIKPTWYCICVLPGYWCVGHSWGGMYQLMNSSWGVQFGLHYIRLSSMLPKPKEIQQQPSKCLYIYIYCI